MDYLEKIESRIARYQQQIIEAEAEIEELQALADGLRKFVEQEEPPAPVAPKRGRPPRLDPVASNGHADAAFNLQTATASDVAEHVLESNDPGGAGMHYNDISEQAAKLGWNGQSDSLRRAMGKNPERFVSLGESRYRLKTN